MSVRGVEHREGQGWRHAHKAHIGLSPGKLGALGEQLLSRGWGQDTLCGGGDPEWKGLVEVNWWDRLHKPGQLELAAQGCVQLGFEYLQECRLHNLSGQPVPVLGHPHRGLGRAAEVER